MRPVSVNTHTRRLNAFLRWAFEEKLVSSLFTFPRLQAEKRALATFAPAQISRFVHFKGKRRAETRAHLLVCLLVDTEMRIGEALQLKRADVDLDNLLLKLKGKGSKETSRPFHHRKAKDTL